MGNRKTRKLEKNLYELKEDLIGFVAEHKELKRLTDQSKSIDGNWVDRLCELERLKAVVGYRISTAEKELKEHK